MKSLLLIYVISVVMYMIECKKCNNTGMLPIIIISPLGEKEQDVIICECVLEQIEKEYLDKEATLNE